MTKGTAVTLICTIIATAIAVLGYFNNSKQVVVVNPGRDGDVKVIEPRGGGAPIPSPDEEKERQEFELRKLQREEELSRRRHKQELEKLKREEKLAQARLELEQKRRIEAEERKSRLENEEHERRLVAKAEERKRRLEDERHERARILAERRRAEQTPNISGKWSWSVMSPMGNQTFVVHFQQRGTAITMQEFDQIGNMLAEGNGTIQNRLVSFNFTEMAFSIPVQFRASMELSQDGQRLSGQIVSPINSVPATFFKQ